MLMRQSALALLGLIAVSSAVTAQTTCSVAPAKVDQIRRMLCGGFAPEAEYRTAGQGCAERSLSARLADSAIQLQSYRMCGDPAFADRMLQGIRAAMKPVEQLATCLGERIDTAAILQRHVASVSARAANASCDPSLRAMAEQRKPHFERMTAISADPAPHQAVFERLGVAVDAQGNVRDR